MKLRVPYFVWREGRPRWVPGPKLRRRGFKGRDLKDDAGAWLPLEAAIAAANLLTEQTKRDPQARPPRPPRKAARSCRALYDLWIKNPRFLRRAASTRSDYISKVEIFLSTEIGNDDVPQLKGKTFADVPVAALSSGHLDGLWEHLYEHRGHATANGVIRAVSVMLTYARRKEWRLDNPASKLGMELVPPRQMLWLPEHVAAFVAKADELGHFSLADAVIIALHSGQRQADVLAMPERLFDDRSIKLSQLRVKMRQKKTRALIDAPMTPACQARIAAIKERRRRAGGGEAEKVVDLNAPIIRREDNGQKHDKNSLGRLFREVRAVLAGEREEGGNGAPRYPGIEALQFLDLRDTAVTRLALADCTLPQIASITGHSLQSITDIMKHYLVLQPQMADDAINKLTTWLEREQIEL